MNESYDQLQKDQKTPKNAEKQKNSVLRAAVAKATGTSNLRLSNKSTGALVATDLASALKMWRTGYSSATIFSEIYADANFTQKIDTSSSTPATETTKTDADKDEETSVRSPFTLFKMLSISMAALIPANIAVMARF